MVVDSVLLQQGGGEMMLAAGQRFSGSQRQSALSPTRTTKLTKYLLWIAAGLAISSLILIFSSHRETPQARQNQNAYTKAKGNKPKAAPKFNIDEVKIDRNDPVVWKEKLDYLPRPDSIIIPKTNFPIRSDHQVLAEKAIKDAIDLKKAGVSFRLLVFAWKRRASLKRLTDSLLKAEYHGFPVHLDIHMDGGPHPRVVEFVDNLEWPHGRIRVNRHVERVGLERTIMEGWQPVSDTEFAFFFEDDIEVSPKYFEYCLVALNRYIMPSGVRIMNNSSNIWTEKLVGFSLNTPRYDEINMPPRDWIPENVMAPGDTQFLFQLPCSWGALYFPWIWRSFLDYYNWRRDHTPEHLDDSIPDAATMYWRRSWKKYLIEFMWMRGQVMLYPALTRQISFSTHHREPGEHTDAKPEEPLVDDLGTLVLDYFTVPLLNPVKDLYEYRRLLAEMKPLRELTVVSIHHEKVANLRALIQRGLVTTYLMESDGWDHSKYIAKEGCVLDSVSFPNLHPPSTDQGEKYLLYEPQLSLSHQINAMRNAFAYARLLNRTLIIPPWVAPNNASISVPVDKLVTFNNVQQEDPTQKYVKTIYLEDYATNHHGWLDRIVHFVPWKGRTSKEMTGMKDELLAIHGITPVQDAIIHAFPTTPSEIIGNFSTCNDNILAFRHLFGSFSNFVSEEENKELDQWVNAKMKLQPKVRKVMDKILTEIFPKPLACAVFSRGDIPANCGKDMQRKKDATEEDKLIAFRSCQAGVDRTMQYAVEDSTALGINLNAIYAIVDVSEEQTAEIFDKGFSPQTQGSRKLNVFSRKDIINELDEAINDVPPELRNELSILFETTLCTQSKFLLHNPYSTVSKRILLHRPEGHLFNTLGKKMNVIQTMPTNNSTTST